MERFVVPARSKTSPLFFSLAKRDNGAGLAGLLALEFSVSGKIKVIGGVGGESHPASQELLPSSHSQACLVPSGPLSPFWLFTSNVKPHNRPF